MKKVKRWFAMMLSGMLLVASSVSQVSAAESDIVESNITAVSSYFTESDMTFLEKLTTVYDVFELDDEGVLILTSSLDEIQVRAGFSDAEMLRFNEMMEFNKDNPAVATEDSIQPRLHVEDWKVYFTYDDVAMYLSAAAAIGPAAITAALSALATTAAPGVGTVIGAIVGYVVSADLCYLVIQAGIKHQGIYIGLDWNGVFPNYTQGTW